MTLAPLLAAPFAIQVHAIAAFALVPLTIVQFARPKVGLSHRALGWTWIALMSVVIVSSFFIFSRRGLVGPYGWIHVLSITMTVSIIFAVRARRMGEIARHRLIMILSALGFAIAGLFTALPGRVVGRMLFG